jgi:L-cysteine S-thiosulfotransferase
MAPDGAAEKRRSKRLGWGGEQMALRRSYRTAAMVAGGILGALALGMNVASASSAAEGQKLAFSKSKGNCVTCHEIKGYTNSGNVAPVLNDMKKRFSRKDLYQIIFDETKRNPHTVMPPFGRNLILTHSEIESIIDFLYTR